MKTIKLFCFSHAGGSAAGFSRWRRLLDPRIELCPIELNGRGTKGSLPFYDSVDSAMRDLFPALAKEAGSAPYAMLGHSMGALLAFEMCHHIRKWGFREPDAVFFSGRLAPHLKADEKILHLLPDDEFKEEIRNLGLTSAELFEHPELLNLFMPILKADFRIIETYERGERYPPLRTDFHILTGKEDRWTQNRIEEWRTLTSKRCQFHEFEGGHFFLYERTPEIIATLHAGLKTAMDSIAI